MLEDLVGRAPLLDFSMVHHHHLVGEFEGLLLVVRHEHAGHTDLVVELPQPLPQFHPHLGVERAEGLIEQEDLRPDGERPGEGHPLPLAAGELRGLATAEAVEPHEVQQFVDLRIDLLRRGFANP